MGILWQAELVDSVSKDRHFISWISDTTSVGNGLPILEGTIILLLGHLATLLPCCRIREANPSPKI